MDNIQSIDKKKSRQYYHGLEFNIFYPFWCSAPYMVQFCRIYQSDSKTFIHRVLDPYFRALVEHGKCKENLHIENTLEIELLIKISDIGHRHNGLFHHTTRRQQIFFRTFVTHTHTIRK